MSPNTIRAKFRCSRVAFSGDPTDPNTPRQYTFTAVYDQSTAENRRFAKATPWGEVTMNVDNPAARFEPGVEYYLDFTKCTEATELPAADVPPSDA